jgi:hypothetical protein
MVGKLATKGSTRGVWLAVLVLAGMLLAVWSSPADAATTFIVNRAGDAADRNIDDTVCDTSRDRGRQCTLRAAIQEANSELGPDTINFNIGATASVQTIFPGSGSPSLGALPPITEAVTIDGYSQRGAVPGTPDDNAVLKIQLRGIDAGGCKRAHDHSRWQYGQGPGDKPLPGERHPPGGLKRDRQ